MGRGGEGVRIKGTRKQDGKKGEKEGRGEGGREGGRKGKKRKEKKRKEFQCREISRSMVIPARLHRVYSYARFIICCR